MVVAWFFKQVGIASAIALGTLGILSTKFQRARFYYRCTVYLLTLGFVSATALFTSIFATLAGQRLNINYYVSRSFYYLASPLVNMPFKVEGREHLDRLITARDGKPQPAVLVGNHQSMVDILFMGSVFPRRTVVMAKKELQMSPFLGQYMTLAGSVFINRRDRKSAHLTVQRAGQFMKKKGVSLWIFPEGTRSSSPECAMLPFKKGAFHLAIDAQVPIISVVCENYHHLFDGSSRFESGTVHVKVLPPISTIGMTSDDVHRLADMTYQQMFATLKEISKSTPSASATINDDELADGDAPIAAAGRAAAEAAGVTPKDAEGLRQRAPAAAAAAAADVASAGASAPSAASSASLSETPSQLETTEDEMDDDAVVLKRPAE